MSATLGDSLLAKAVSCAISVVKANHVQGGAATNRVRREVFLWLLMALFSNSTCYLSVGLYVWSV